MEAMYQAARERTWVKTPRDGTPRAALFSLSRARNFPEAFPFETFLRFQQSTVHLGSRCVTLRAIGSAGPEDDGIQGEEIGQVSAGSKRCRDFRGERRIAAGAEHVKHHT